MKPVDASSRILQKAFSPGNYDVICGRGKGPANHIGNKRFKIVIKNYYERYSNAGSKFEKSLLVSEIVDTIRESSGEGGFVKFNPMNGGYWYEVGDQLAREKVSQELRNLLFNQYKSSNVQKLRRRKKRRENEMKDLFSASSEYDLMNNISPNLRKGNSFDYTPISNVSSGTSSASNRGSLNSDIFNDSIALYNPNSLQEVQKAQHPDILVSNPSVGDFAADETMKSIRALQAQVDQAELEIKREQMEMRLSACIKDSSLHINNDISGQNYSEKNRVENMQKVSNRIKMEGDEFNGLYSNMKEAHTNRDTIKDSLAMTLDYPGISFSPRPFNVCSKIA